MSEPLSGTATFQIVIQDDVESSAEIVVGRCLSGEIRPGDRFTGLATPDGSRRTVGVEVVEILTYNRPSSLISTGLTARLRLRPGIRDLVNGAVLIE